MWHDDFCLFLWELWLGMKALGQMSIILVPKTIIHYVNSEFD